MIVKFTNFNNGVHQIDFEKPAKDLNLPPEFQGDVKVKCKMDKSNHQIVLDCKLSCFANFRCDRCNDEFQNYIENEFRLVYIFSEQVIENDDLNLQYLSLDATKIDISEEVTEYCLLSVPLKILCKEDCKGLCTKCGLNLNLDSCICEEEKTNALWEKLNKLKK
ncbi:MAG: DUF177 domain-containing protein [bacterium]